MPGLNVSQIYQVYQFSKECGYSYCIQWPDAERLVKKFSEIPELEGINVIRRYLSDLAIVHTIDFGSVVIKYIDAVNKGAISYKNNVYTRLFECPQVDVIIQEMLKELGK